MSLVQRLRDAFARSSCLDFDNVSLRIDRGVAYHLVPIAERMSSGTHEASSQLNAIRPFFLSERPLISIIKGDDIWVHVEGPEYDCAGTIYPLGAQVFIDKAGWLNLGPAEAIHLHQAIRRAVDAAAYRWLSERRKLELASPCRSPRDRSVEDEIALRQMAAAAGQDHLVMEPSHA